MRTLPAILFVHALVLGTFIWFAGPACADSNTDYRAGSDFAKQVQGGGLDALKNFNGEQNLPGYTKDPEQKKYYGGVTAGGDSSLKNDSASQWAGSEVGQSITESFTNRPPDSISPDAPFIQNAKDIESRSDTIIGNTGQECKAEIVNRSEFKNYTCERDLQVEQYCTRTATITGHYEETTVIKTYTVPNNQFSYSYDGNKSVMLTFRAPATGTVLSASAALHFNDKNMYYRMTWWGVNEDSVAKRDNSWSLPGATGAYLTEGGSSPQGVILNKNCLSGEQSRCREYARKTQNWLQGGSEAWMSVTLTMRVTEKKWVPDVKWVEFCPFSKDEGKQTTTECIEPGGNRTVNQDGNVYQVYQACWKYRDTYITQPSDYGSCQTLMDNHNCTLASRQCAFTSDDGTCLHEYATYSCETRTTGKQMICGGDVFCLDGECDKAASGKNNDFGQAVAELAALAAAGKDVAALNGVDVRAFTGKAKYCKKFAAGFSNCCKDSGWGQDVGLARCSSDEKALAKAKKDKLTVSVGEFCSKKVLGVCLEKKRSYCQFDSKLAQIVQQQGRNGQLHISFGGASSPNCRGITVDELQRINFDSLDFTNFMEDLMKNQKIPDNDALTNKTKERIKEIMSQQSSK